MNEIIPFSFEDRDVRVLECEDSPWFVLSDVCDVLDISNSRDAAARLDDDEKAAVGITDTSSNGVTQSRQTTIINESGLYSLILTSRKKAAKRFKKWVTAEVLPAIRKTGGYGKSRDPVEVLNDPEAMRGLLLSYSEKVLALEEKVKEQESDVEAYERIAKSEGALCITDAAKALQMRPKDLFAYLQGHGWIYRRPGGGHYLGYQSKVATALLEHKVTTVLRADGSERVVEQVKVTPKGLAKLAKLLQPIGRVA